MFPLASSTAGTQISSSAAATTRARANVEAVQREVMAAQSRVVCSGRTSEGNPGTAVKAARDLDRMKMLIGKDEISQQQYDAAVSAADAARAGVESAQAAASQVQHEVEVAKAHIAQSQAELQQAQAEAEGAKQLLNMSLSRRRKHNRPKRAFSSRRPPLPRLI